MHLSVRLDPADLPRLKAQPILRRCQRQRMQTRTETGVLQRPPDRALPYRLQRSRCRLGDGGWRAEMEIVSGVTQSPGRNVDFCLVRFSLDSGGAAAFAALLQGLAERVPLRLSRAGAWSDLGELWQDQPPSPQKARPPRLPQDSTAGAALRSMVECGMAHLLHNADCLRLAGAPEAIHQTRVALRRLRAVMTLFKDLLTDSDSQAVRDDLRWLRQVLGAARDWDVLHDDILLPALPLLQGAGGAERLQRQVDRWRVAARQQLLADIATPRFNAALLRLACWCGSVEADPARAAEPLRLWIEETLRRRYRQVRRGLDGLAGYDVARQHECRLQIKKLRYALEFFASRLPERQTQSHVATLAALQDQLGRLNDIAAAERRLCALAAADGDLAWAAGLVAGWHRQRCPGLLDGVAAGWLRLRRQRAFWQTK